MDSKTVIETQIGRTLYIVTSEYSPRATETLEKKLERLMRRHISDAKSYPFVREIPLAMCETVCEDASYSIVKE